MSKSLKRHTGEDFKLVVVIETPRGCRNKFKFDAETNSFSLSSVLPAGAVFPYDFGFVPGTKASDGDPLDVLLLMDEPAFPGCRVKARLIGIIEAEQSEDGQRIRNDRVLAVADEAHDYRDIRSPEDLNHNLLRELEHFFVSYNQARGKKFKLLGVHGPRKALKALREASSGKKKR